MKILITGTTSGLGKYLAANFEVNQLVSWDRASFGGCFDPVDVIVHCAHDRIDPINNIIMLRILRKVPHCRFFYISSIDVYDFEEDNKYADCKRECEILVRNYFDDYKIIRPSLMLGREMRKNTITRMLLGEQLTLSPDSMISCINYGAVMREIDNGCDDVGGSAVTVGYGPMRLGDIATALGLEPKYGVHTYRARMPLDPSNNYTLREIENFRNWHFENWREINNA